MTNIVKYYGYNRGWRMQKMNYMDRLIEEYREEQQRRQDEEFRARLSKNRTAEELFAVLLALGPRCAAEREAPVPV